MPRPTFPAAATGLPTATILRFPTEREVTPFGMTFKEWSDAFVTLSVADQFVGMDHGGIDRAFLEMLESREASVKHMLVKNGEVIVALRCALAFLIAMDARVQASVHRLLDARAC